MLLEIMVMREEAAEDQEMMEQQKPLTKNKAIEMVREELAKKEIQVENKDVSKVIAMICNTEGGNRGSASISLK